MYQKFNPKDWLSSDNRNDIDRVVSRIEALQTDITGTYADFPEFLKKVVAPCLTDEERDIMLLGALGTISSCCPNVYGIYDKKRVFTNLFVFITAQASAGKGNLVLCKRLVSPVHRELRKLSKAMKAQYEAEMREYNLMKMKDFSLEKPVKPPEKMLFIPANNSGFPGCYFDGKGFGKACEPCVF